MKYILQNKYVFLIVFSSIITVDIYVKLNLEVFPYRLISKPLVMLSLLLFFIYNYNENKSVKFIAFSIGILCFLIGDLFLIFDSNELLFLIGMLFFIAGKLIYIFRLTTNKEFSILKLIPLLIFSFIYIICLLHFIFKELGDFTIPVLLYYFISQILLLMSYLRLGSVNYKSYLLILFGVVAFIISETIVALSIFHVKMDYQDSAIMIFYGLSQFLIISGIIKENRVAVDG